MSSCCRFAVAVAALAFGWESATADGLRFERLFGPEVPTGDYKHPASVTELANGDLFVAFFSGNCCSHRRRQGR